MTEKLFVRRYFKVLTGAYHRRVKYYFIEYNYMFNAPKEKKHSCSNMNKIKCLKTSALAQSN